MEVTLYDYITLKSCGIWRVDPTVTGDIVFKGRADTFNEGCRLELHRASRPDQTPGQTLMICTGSDGKPYFYQVSNDMFQVITEAAHPFWPIPDTRDPAGVECRQIGEIHEPDAPVTDIDHVSYCTLGGLTWMQMGISGWRLCDSEVRQ